MPLISAPEGRQGRGLEPEARIKGKRSNYFGILPPVSEFHDGDHAGACVNAATPARTMKPQINFYL